MKEIANETNGDMTLQRYWPGMETLHKQSSQNNVHDDEGQWVLFPYHNHLSI